jgi:putative flippase GtrA
MVLTKNRSLSGGPRAGVVPLFGRYLVAGLGSFAADFSVFTLLTHGASLDPLISHLLSRPLGGLTCFYLNRTWTFRSSGPIAAQLVRFWAVFGASLALTEGLLALFCKGIGIPAVAAKALAEAIAVAFNFLALWHWTFAWRSEA